MQRLRAAWSQPLLLSSLLLLTAGPALAAPLQQVTLPNGRLVELEDDFTWHYVVLKPTSAATPAVNVAKPSTPVAAGADATNMTATTPTPAAAPALNQQALQDPALLAETAAQGVKIRYLDSTLEGNTLQPKFEVSNQADGSVVRITGQITLYDANGQQILSTETRFWQAEYRLPDTYLRQGQTRQYQAPAITLPQTLPNGARPLVRMTIVAVERRS